MKKIITLLAIAAMAAFIMVSCSGNGSSKKGPFGSLPDVYEQFMQEKDQIAKEAEKITTEAEKAKLMEKSEKMQGKYKAKLEESAKALDGKAITVESDVITVTEPISFQFEKFFSESTLQPYFKVNGKAEVATDITGRRIGAYYTNPTETVYLVGYDAEGKEVYKFNIGEINAENKDGYSFIPAGAPVKFNGLTFSLRAQDYKDAQTLKLEIR